MQPFPELEPFKGEIVEFDFSELLSKPLEPKPDPFIERYAGKVYYDPWVGIDFRMNPWMKNNRAVERAIWSFASGAVTVPTILPTYLDPAYIYAVPTDAPAYASLARKASLGAHEDYVRVTALGSPTAYWVAQDAAPDYVSPDSARVSQPKVIAETWGGVTGFHRAAGRGFKDMLEEAHTERLYGLLTEALEGGILNGDDVGNNAKGLLTWQGTTNEVAAGSAAPTLAQIQDAIRLAFVKGGNLESYGFAITDPTTYDTVKNLLIEYLNYVNVENYDLPWGLKTFAVQGVPFIKSRKMPTGANVKKILFVDRRYSYLAVLTDVTTELYGKTKDAQEFAIKWYGNAINRAPEFGAVISGIV